MDAWYVANHFDAFVDIHVLMADDRSRETLRVVMMAMLTGDHAPLKNVLERDQYFCLPRFAGAAKEIYVDAGAYVGDSVERFIWANAGVFQKIYAFEPSPRQFDALEARGRRLRQEWALDEDVIQLTRAGLGDQTAIMAGATASGQLQSMSLHPSSEGDVVTVSLDEYLAGAPATFIKADVEGMEMALLAGAAKTIVACRPKLAICVYHYPSDVPTIARYIRSLVPDYKFALRHHSPQLMETVLYCWVD
ncbi:FkbM family methyltransferase [Ciceribacter sp. L1K22]|uniref:FkbM family methyltransferase n=1 Tax=Ciceribacter sp. L1K22 TaxID=2820275 RepID=UPI001ABDC4A2|nr:FkbM family methyltransferase [Ciceribacter sp. L1K22]MBO3762255.1 FkbM family methyltransferase [Ciceribacter sp. L1K22]